MSAMCCNRDSKNLLPSGPLSYRNLRQQAHVHCCGVGREWREDCADDDNVLSDHILSVVPHIITHMHSKHTRTALS